MHSVLDQKVEVDRNVAKQEHEEQNVHQDGRLVRVAVGEDGQDVNENHSCNFVENV